MVRAEDFFVASNLIGSISNDGYNVIGSLISSVDAVARVTYQSMYLIDYYKREFLYVSGNPLFLCGHTAKEVKKKGFRFYLKHVPEEDQKRLREININGYKFLETFGNTDKLGSSISCDFHLLHGNKKILVNQKQTPVLLTDNGQVWITLCFVSFSFYKTPGHAEFRLNSSPDYWCYSFETHKWEAQQGVMLKEEEREVLRLYLKGLTSIEIAESMSKTINTIKFYKHELFKKLGTNRLPEAIARAVNYKLL